jgi:multidrug efflux pump subunit AcrA (membrane-fusion protein)
MKIIASIKKLSLAQKIILLTVIIAGCWFAYSKISGFGTNETSYQTYTVEKGTFMTTLSASGTITSGDTTYITTGASGTVKKVYVKNGDIVVKNQKIAEITLDDIGGETQTTAWNNYQEALIDVKESETQKETDYITMLQKKDALKNAETAKRDGHSGGWNPTTRNPYTENELLIVDKQYEQAVATYNAAVSNNSISDTNIALARAKVSAAYRNYQKVSSNIVAPVSGIINNLVLAEGIAISSSSDSSITVSTGSLASTESVSVSSKQVGAIKNPDGQYQATVNLTEVDVTKVQSGQKVTLLLDAYPDNTLTGTVLAVSTSGSVSSGVTSYSATILLDKTTLNLYTNMAVSATIIISTKDSVLLLDSAAIETSVQQSSVLVKKDGVVSTVNIKIGDANDSQTEVVSGLNEGDTVVTITTKSTTKESTGTSGSSSLFGGNSGIRGGMEGPGF